GRWRARLARYNPARVFRHGWRFLPALAALSFVILAGATAWVVSLGPAPTGAETDHSTLVVCREGRVLRAYRTLEGRWRLPTTVEDVDPRFFALLFAYEDKRFRSHLGVDPAALARAALQLFRNGHIISGGSTLTMQVARLIEPRRERNL